MEVENLIVHVYVCACVLCVWLGDLREFEELVKMKMMGFFYCKKQISITMCRVFEE